MKILHITDSHGTVKSPEGRCDIYYIAFLKKLYELGYVCKKIGVDMVIHTGDLFHTARVSNKFAGQVSEMIKAMGVPFYVVPGNHDIEGYTIDTIDQTMLGLLSKAGVITLLDRENPITITDTSGEEEYTIAISGQEYYAHIDEGNTQDFEMQQEEADLNILAIHGYIADTPQHPNIKCTMVQDIITDADIILTGHYHRQFQWGNQDLDIYNPGSMMRVEQTEYNKTHVPHYGILTTGLTTEGEIIYDYQFYHFRTAQPSTVVFDYDSKYKQKMASITLEGFKTSLENTIDTLDSSMDIVDIIESLCFTNKIEQKIEISAVKRYMDTLRKIPDEFEAPQGYIESMYAKKIKSVHLKNFQSHEDTFIEFSDGLNIIVGESNNGKTSIIRGIMWAIDNYPLGKDFIMAGKKDCSVRICYDDGTFIERGRTMSDTGYYNIGYIDNGAIKTVNYSGFTNAIPIEVANVHQMPKVNITKDIETHLNVLSQLDAPFLLTESPQVKAAAIGRITGTHVIDAAIKDNNKSIRENKVIIKDTDKNIKELEDKILQLPDIKIIKSFMDAYKDIVGYLKLLDTNVQIANDQIQKIQDIENEIASVRNDYKRYCALRSIKNIVDEYSEYSYIYSEMNKIQQCEADISKESFSLKENSAKVLLKSIVDYAHNLYQEIDRLTSFMGEIKLVKANITVGTQIHVRNVVYASNLKILIDYSEKENSYIYQVSQYLDGINKVSQDTDTAKKDLQSYKKYLRSVQNLIKETKNERTEFILKEKICPCCGQPISSEEHVNHINNFMEDLNSE